MGNSSNARKRPLSPEQLAVCARLRTIWDSRKKELDLRQDSVGGLMNISQGAVGHFLNKRNALSFEATLWFAEVLQVHPFDIDPKVADHLPKRIRDLIANMEPERPLTQPMKYKIEDVVTHAINEPKK